MQLRLPEKQEILSQNKITKFTYKILKLFTDSHFLNLWIYKRFLRIKTSSTKCDFHFRPSPVLNITFLRRLHFVQCFRYGSDNIKIKIHETNSEFLLVHFDVGCMHQKYMRILLHLLVDIICLVCYKEDEIPIPISCSTEFSKYFMR